MDMEMEFESEANGTNGSAGWQGNNSSTYAIENAPTLVMCISMTICVWIIISNSVMVCVMSTRETMSNVNMIQILSLAISDVMVGVAYVPVSVTYYLIGSFPDYFTCATLLGIFIVAQTAALFQMFGVCAYRAVVSLRRSRLPREQRPFLILVLHLTIPWAASSMLAGTLIHLHSDKDRAMHACSGNILLRDNYRTVMPIFGLIWLVTEVTIILVYTFISVRLLVISQRTTTLHRPHDRTAKSPTIIASSSHTPESQHQEDDKNMPDRQSHNTNTKTIARNRVIALKKWHKKMLVTIGILLGLMILCVTPFAMMIVLEYNPHLMTNVMKRETKFLLAALCGFNSIANPFVYGTRIQSVRQSIKRIWLRVRSACKYTHAHHVAAVQTT